MPSPRVDPPAPLLRPGEQLGVAVLVALSLVAAAGWWLAQGGWQGRLVDLEQAPRQRISYQVDINTAQAVEWLQLPGVGPKLAQRIIESRAVDGPFHDHDDLGRVRGIGPKTLDRLRPYLLPMPDAEGRVQGPGFRARKEQGGARS